MRWQFEPSQSVATEIEKGGESEAKRLIGDVRKWILEAEWEDLAMARAIIELGHSEEYAWWLVKEARLEDIDEMHEA